MKVYIVSPLFLVLAAIFPSTTIRRPDWKRSESMEWVGLETKFDDISGQVQAIKEKIESTRTGSTPTLITPNLPIVGPIKWGPQFHVTFDVLFTDFVGSWYKNILTFTTHIGHCCDPGDRIPAVMLKMDEQRLQVASQIGSNGNLIRTSEPVVINTWYHLEIKQVLDKTDNKYYFEASIDGEPIFNKTENENPTQFEKVTVMAGLLEFKGDGLHHAEPIQEAYFSNLIVQNY